MENKKKWYKTWWGIIIIILIAIIMIGCLFGNTEETNSNSENKNNTTENQNNNVNTNESKDDIEPNTSAMVDYLAKKGKEDSKIATEEQLNTALTYIKNNVDNFFKDNETMENVIYYGSLLEYYYDGGKVNSDIKGQIGMDSVQAVKYVYRNVEKTTDNATVENIRQVKEGLAKLQ